MDHVAYQSKLRQMLAGRESAFPDAEYDRRQHLLNRKMSDNGLDAILVTQPSDIYYLTGYNTFEVSVHTALIYGPDRCVLQVPSIETGPAIACARCDEVIGYRWEGPGEVLEPLADTLSGMGSRIGLDFWGGGLRAGVVEGLRQRLNRHALIDVSGILASIKRVKSAVELECLQQSARITETGIQAARSAVAVGNTDNAVASAAAGAMIAAGSEFMSMQPIVVAGRRSSVIHTNHRRFTIAEREPVFIELGSAWQRYTSPIMHTVIAGSEAPDARMLNVFDTCRQVYECLLAAMRPGNTFGEAARVANEALRPIQDDVFFSGVFGYTVGAQFPPSWVEGSGFIAVGEDDLFEENMVFHLPLCFRIPGVWGIGFSDTVRVGATAAEPITRNDWRLTGSNH
ncbi:M24 family metallopeptidase [Marinobacter sp. 1Y8]